MQNPFQVVLDRLAQIESLIIRSFPDNHVKSDAKEVGGLPLAQEITRLSKARIYALVSSRKIPHSKRGNKLYFRRDELLAWVDAGRRDEHNPTLS